MKSIIVKSPCRVDLAGGTLDLWPLYLFIGGACTLNVAIDIYTHVEIIPWPSEDDKRIKIKSLDLQYEVEFDSLNEFFLRAEEKLDLIKAQLKFWKPLKGFQLITKSESPIGGGLGGSSSLTISLLKAFQQFCSVSGGSREVPFSSQGSSLSSQGSALSSQSPSCPPFGGSDLDGDIYSLVNIAHNIEAEVLNTPTGTQDYFPAAQGGLNILRYDYQGVHQSLANCLPEEISDHFLLAYTGKAHHSGLNNFSIVQKAVLKDSHTLSVLKELKKISDKMSQAIEAKNWKIIPECFQEEYQARLQLADTFSSPEIEKLANISITAGAEAVKICGAGGGGCVLIWVPPARREKVIEKCQTEGFQILKAKPLRPF